MTNELAKRTVLLKLNTVDCTLEISGSSPGVEGAAFPVVELLGMVATNTIMASIKE
jgi:hypothetical protein